MTCDELEGRVSRTQARTYLGFFSRGVDDRITFYRRQAIGIEPYARSGLQRFLELLRKHPKQRRKNHVLLQPSVLHMFASR